jgi:hypothetical protein
MGKKEAWRRKMRFDMSVLYWIRRGYGINEVAHIKGCNPTKVIASIKRLKDAGKIKWRVKW